MCAVGYAVKCQCVCVRAPVYLQVIYPYLRVGTVCMKPLSLSGVVRVYQPSARTTESKPNRRYLARDNHSLNGQRIGFIYGLVGSGSILSPFTADCRPPPFRTITSTTIPIQQPPHLTSIKPTQTPDISTRLARPTCSLSSSRKCYPNQPYVPAAPSITNLLLDSIPFLRGAELDGTTVVYSNPFAVGIGEGATMEMLETGEPGSGSYSRSRSRSVWFWNAFFSPSVQPIALVALLPPNPKPFTLTTLFQPYFASLQ